MLMMRIGIGMTLRVARPLFIIQTDAVWLQDVFCPLVREPEAGSSSPAKLHALLSDIVTAQLGSDLMHREVLSRA